MTDGAYGPRQRSPFAEADDADGGRAPGRSRHELSGPAGLPPALVASQQRAAAARAAAARSVARARARRRLVPPLVIGSATLIGAGAAGAWVDAGMHTAGTASLAVSGAGTGAGTGSGTGTATGTGHGSATGTATGTGHGSATGQVSAAGAAASAASELDRARQELAQAEAAIGTLQATAGPAASGSTTPGPASAAAPVAPVATVPTLPPIPTVQIPAPAVHATTGASHAIP